jgi:uncharacterized protein YqgC (DUF456 family)
METLFYLIALTCALIGFIGTVLPLLPGTTLILIGAVVLKLGVPASLSWTVVAVVAALWLLSVVTDFLGVALGARLGGGGKWAMGGASAGALVGMFWALPGILLGTFLGAALAERCTTDKSIWQNLKAGLGAGAGFLLATGFRVVLALAMVGVMLWAALSRGA